MVIFMTEEKKVETKAEAKVVEEKKVEAKAETPKVEEKAADTKEETTEKKAVKKTTKKATKKTTKKATKKTTKKTVKKTTKKAAAKKETPEAKEDAKEETTEKKTVKKTKKKKKKKETKIIITKAKKKTSIARAAIKAGKGRITINSKSFASLHPKYLRELVREPVILAEDIADKVDIKVNVHGGGTMGQAVASRGAIAKALVAFSNSEELKNKYLAYDRLLLVDDVRRKEPKKQLGRGARARKQLSKR